MTNICYTLEEAAEKLNLSETVLVRLSQYLKMPRSAYEEAGYLSFKGDLSFGEQDLAFFQKVKERLLMGESLDDVKSRIPQKTTSILSEPAEPALPQAEVPNLADSSPSEPKEQEPSLLGGSSVELTGELPAMSEIKDRKPYEKAAEKSFERYKSKHRSTLGKVFENMLKEVGGPKTGRRSETVTPAFRPMRNQAHENAEGQEGREITGLAREDARLPFVRSFTPEGDSPSPQVGYHPDSIAKKFGTTPQPAKPIPSHAIWQPMIQQAAQKPRTLNIQLKNAALLLRQQTLGHPHQQDII